MGTALAGTSRLLDEKEKCYREHQKRVRRAISFKDINSGSAEAGEPYLQGITAQLSNINPGIVFD
jgi:hypothetical protein